MQILKVLTFIAIICSLQISISEALYENAIKEFLEEFRARMCHPIPSLGLPALDPIQISHKSYETDGKYLIEFDGSITDLSVTGLSDFVINDINIPANIFRRSNINITFPLTTLKSLYTANGWVYYLFELAGDGNAYTHIKEVTIDVSFVLSIPSFLIRALRIELKVGEIFVNLDHFLEKERLNDFLHALINELGLELLDDVWKAKEEPITQFVEKYINKLMADINLGTIIGGGGGGGNGPWGDVPADCKD